MGLKITIKNMLGNIGNLFVKCMRQVTKGHLYHLLGVCWEGGYTMVECVCVGWGGGGWSEGSIPLR